VRLDRPLDMGSSLLSLADAHANKGNQQDAVQAAEDAVSLFQQMGDQRGVESAKLVLETVKQPRPKPQPKAEASAPSETAKKPKPAQPGGQFVPRDMDMAGYMSQPSPAGHGGQQGQPPASRARAGRRTNFSAQAMEVEQRSGVHLRPPSPARNDPDQEKRRQQLLAAMEARAVRAPMAETHTQSQLRDVLRKVRPDWNTSELSLVIEKLAAIEIETDRDLFRQLNDLGAKGVNQKLKDRGKRPLKKETLDALREYGDRSASEALHTL